MNPFDAVVYAVAVIAVLVGFNAGLLRSLATILGYLIAAPLAVAIAPRAMALMPNLVPPSQAWLVPLGVFLLAGELVSALLRSAVSGFAGNEISLVDRGRRLRRGSAYCTGRLAGDRQAGAEGRRCPGHHRRRHGFDRTRARRPAPQGPGPDHQSRRRHLPCRPGWTLPRPHLSLPRNAIRACSAARGTAAAANISTTTSMS
jgi:hypothetical protein